MADENIVQLPTLLERLATRMTGLLKQEAANRTEWIEIQEGICLTLAEARDQFPWNTAFGKWCEDNGFGADVINENDRAAAIEMGRDPVALLKCLQVTERFSLQMICRHEFQKFSLGSATKTKTKRQAKLDTNKPSPQFEKAIDAIEELLAEGAEVTAKAVRERAGVSDTPVRIAMAHKRAEAELAPLTRAEMSKLMERRFDLAVRQARAEIRAELKAEVYADCEVFWQHIKERSARADRILDNFKGVISRENFRRIKACLHPDHNKFAFAAEAFQVFSELEDRLVKPDPAPSGTPPLPATVAELMAMRRRR